MDSISPNNLVSGGTRKNLIIIFVIFTVVVVAVLLFSFIRNGGKAPVDEVKAVPSTSPLDSHSDKNLPGRSKVKLLKVGEEIIFSGDLDYEMEKYPDNTGKEVKTILLNKLVEDSIVIQEGIKKNLITADNTVFNSPDKDYVKRLVLVREVKQKLSSQATRIEGYFVSLWFNNVRPGPAGYDTGKALAYDKISLLYSQVKEGSLTIQAAGEAIKNDSSLAQIDPAYKSNAIAFFSKRPNERITFDETFDQELKSIEQAGGLTQLRLLKDKDLSGKYIDSVYIFGQITKKTAENGTVEDYKTLIERLKKSYEITYF